jgi:hypothetical protein
VSKLKTTAQLGIGAGGAISTVCGLIADFFMPVAPYGIYLGFAALILLLISLGLFFIPATDRKLGELMGDSWYLPSFVLLLLFTVSMFGFYYMGKSAPGTNGYLAGSFEELSKLQSEILESTKKIESNTATTAENTRYIADTVKKEISDNPRKELANRGIGWSEDNLMQAVMRGDIETIELFLSGGMSLSNSAWIRIFSKIDDAGLRHLSTSLDLIAPNLNENLELIFYDYEIDKNGLIQEQIDKYRNELSDKLLNEQNQNALLEQNRYTEDSINFIRELEKFIFPLSNMTSSSNQICNVKLKTLHDEMPVLATIRNYKDLDRHSMVINSVDWALDDIERYCPEMIGSQAQRPERPNFIDYKTSPNMFGTISSNVWPEKIVLTLLQFAKLINPDLDNFFKTKSFYIERKTQVILSNGDRVIVVLSSDSN